MASGLAEISGFKKKQQAGKDFEIWCKSVCIGFNQGVMQMRLPGFGLIGLIADTSRL